MNNILLASILTSVLVITAVLVLAVVWIPFIISIFILFIWQLLVRIKSPFEINIDKMR